MKKLLIIGGLLLATVFAVGQKDVTTFGISVKPLIPNSFVNFTTVEADSTNFSGSWSPKASLNFGMAIRYGFTETFSLETGIYLVRRKYDVQLNDFDENLQGNMDFIFQGYEVPIQGSYFVQLGENLWMNAAGGLSIDMHASDVFSTDDLLSDTTYVDFEQYTARYKWVQLSVIANYGFEWRTRDNGYFYLGASYHQPFSPIARGEGIIKYDDQIRRVFVDLEGSYFTLDFRYFFHEDPERKRKKTKKGTR
ncbi:MAG: outer membrane beta-barrel protein [Flavobacteriales bacterium]|nr:outer membrane beta-barrel protein [Flavobacteriales bacterium]MDG1781595.1 outer membrane beta-barrel protein [Flavobacteriales bacterium]